MSLKSEFVHRSATREEEYLDVYKGKDDEVLEVFSTKGLLFSEQSQVRERFCRPKLIPLKSLTLQKVQELEKRTTEVEKQHL